MQRGTNTQRRRMGKERVGQSLHCWIIGQIRSKSACAIQVRSKVCARKWRRFGAEKVEKREGSYSRHTLYDQRRWIRRPFARQIADGRAELAGCVYVLQRLDCLLRLENSWDSVRRAETGAQTNCSGKADRSPPTGHFAAGDSPMHTGVSQCPCLKRAPKSL